MNLITKNFKTFLARIHQEQSHRDIWGVVHIQISQIWQKISGSQVLSTIVFIVVVVVITIIVLLLKTSGFLTNHTLFTMEKQIR